MINKRLAAIAAVLLIANLAIAVWQFIRTPHVAYVRSSELVYGYFGMKEAMNLYEINEKSRQGEIDTLVSDLQHIVTLTRQFEAQNDKQEVARLSAQIEMKQNQLIKHKRILEERSKEEEQKVLDGVLSQINAFVESYAEEKGYDIVFGTTTDGSILYGRLGLDITDEVLVALNKQHEGL